ncbi:immunomodulatory protein [Leucogyrophana mollusca]|uniref:Immunomodulatory protein n=1 Tax=Leucogyrophana mollusca TaxID=85980 RepID=A0ACB8B4H8_9AGAM|nr:immunomodulatory protein [Leucogyrophana mollusca]
MKFATVALSFAALVLPALSQATYSLSYDTLYDESTLSLDDVSCSDGTNGLITKGYTTLGQLPTFPNVGGAIAVTGWNSAACGSCWEVTYGSETIAVTAVDVALDGFNLSEEAMNTLTGGLAVELGRVNVTAVQVAASTCGL